MKKLSKQAKSKLLNTLLIFGTIGAVLIIGASTGNIGDAWATMANADPLWLGVAVAAFFGFVIFESLTTVVFLRFQHLPLRFGTGLIVTLIGLFYSNVTPGATGGQPMQVVAMRKRGVPSGYTTSALAVKFFCFEMALLLTGLILWIFHWGFAFEHIGDSKWLIFIGFFLNGLVVAAVVLLAINKSIVRGILRLCMKLGKKLHLIRNEERVNARLTAAMNDFHYSVHMLTHRPKHLTCIFLLSCMQVLCYMSIIYCVAMALGVKEYSYGQLITLQYLLYIGASFTPLPGASGTQEGGFYLIFNQIFPPHQLLGALLIWRFFTYYFSMIVSLLFGVVLDSARSIRGRIRPIELPPDLQPPPGDEDPPEEFDTL